jgi:hypothetical protein
MEKARSAARDGAERSEEGHPPRVQVFIGDVISIGIASDTFSDVDIRTPRTTNGVPCGGSPTSTENFNFTGNIE